MVDRGRTVQADLDGPWPDLGPADLIWALAATELDSFPRFMTGRRPQPCRTVRA